jgi:hypothetical protein
LKLMISIIHSVEMFACLAVLKLVNTPSQQTFCTPSKIKIIRFNFLQCID